MVKLTGLWKNQGKNGEYWSGTLGNAKIIILPNNYKTKDSQPDFNIFIDEGKKQEKAAEQQQGDAAEQVEDDDELPF